MRGVTAVTLAAACLVMVGIALPAIARAGELSLLINGTALHDGQPRNGAQLNERNWGAGLQYMMAKVSGGWFPVLTAAQFLDSNGNSSSYAGGGVMRRYQAFGGAARDLNFDAGFIAFMMTRKGFNNDNPFPGIIPAFSLGGEKVSVNMSYIPRVDPTSVPLLFLQLRITLVDF